MKESLFTVPVLFLAWGCDVLKYQICSVYFIVVSIIGVRRHLHIMEYSSLYIFTTKGRLT